MRSIAMITILHLVLFSRFLKTVELQTFYMVTQKPVITYSDPTIIPFINFTSVRYSRRSDLYYSHLHVDVAVPLDNNFSVRVEVVFYEAVNTQFRRSFIEMHYELCNFILKDPIFGAALRKQLKFETCPLPKGTYHFYNMTASADHLPAMPFRKGRINMAWLYKKRTAFKGYCDLDLKKKI